MRSKLASKILLLLILFCFCASPALSVDRIYQSGTSLRSSDTLLSNNANFTLGFQRIGTEESNASYLGIWYNAGNSQGRPFWLANRNNPIPDDSGVLAIDASGNFKLSSSTGHVLTIYSSQSSTTNLTAVLQDSGNLILKEAESPDNKFLWQGFDFPTDTLLPGMKLGINHRTDQTWSLNSRLTESVPGSGAFNLEWDPTEHQLVIKRRGTIFWTSGTLTSNDSFETFSMSSNPLRFSFINVSNADEDYFMFTVGPNNYPDNFSMWMLRNDGSIIDSSSMMHGFSGSVCDGNSAELGCKKWEGPQCRNDGDKFVQRSGYFGGSVPMLDYDNSSLSISDCKDMCWKDCRCVGIPLEYNANNTGCRFYYGDITPDPTGTFAMRYYVIAQESPPERNWIWILIAVTLVVIIALGSILFYLRRRRIRANLLNDLLATDDTTNDLQEFENDGNNGHNLKMYSAAAIMAATNSFSLKNKLGQGGFGPVYKGKLPDGREIAVKRLSRSSGQGLVEFKNELILIAKLQHRNLVRLLGFCIQGEEKLLVYEYMPNKSLDSFIFDSSKRGLIDWKKSLEIIEGIAQGMLYLHKYSRLRIIHRDLKASNILLDQDMNPKVSDFGMARIFKINQLESNTNRIVGTYGYMSPEYAMEGIFSVKSDVFSFGVLLLEIVSGRKNHGFLQMDRPINLIGYAWELWREGDPMELMDPTLRGSLYSKEEVLRCIKLGLLCVEDNPSDRPTMSDVVTMLTSDAAQIPAPKQPAFSNARSILDVNSGFGKRETSSINSYSTSTLEAR